MKKLLISLVCTLAVFSFMTIPKAQEKNEPVKVYIFSREGCSHCIDALDFFSKLSADKEYGKMFETITLEVLDAKGGIIDNDYYNLLMKTTRNFGVSFNGTPFIVIGEKYYDGFGQSYSDDIKAQIKECYNKGCTDAVENVDDLLAIKAARNKKVGIIISVISILVIIGLVVGFIFSRLPKKPKAKKIEKTNDNKKQIK